MKRVEEENHETSLTPFPSQGPIMHPSGKDDRNHNARHEKRRTRSIKKHTTMKATKNNGVETEQSFRDAKESLELTVCNFWC